MQIISIRKIKKLKLNLINRFFFFFSCTSEIDSECQRQGAGFYILPPVISGRINTKGKFEFLYGRVEVKAKLPHGDWVYPRKFIITFYRRFAIVIIINAYFCSNNAGECRECLAI